MLFPTHLVAAVILSRVTPFSPWWLLAGAAAPDVIDKPLGMAGVTEVYHSVGHSALLAIILVPLARNSQAGRAVVIGWGSHLLLDAGHVIINGRGDDTRFLLWPVIKQSEPLALPPDSFVEYYIGTPSFFLEVGLWLALLGLGLTRWLRANVDTAR